MLPELPSDPQTAIVSAASGTPSTAQYLVMSFGTALAMLLVQALMHAYADAP